ncbi:hypothetical protein F3Y22_tig00110744pilonHSYRG00083 [Hibiscus syriacus]|uniref:DNA (Cytosine-5)-methyltransferase DRM1/2 n=1 Tax=Hibiscus syriacus TaxID=106335 RepID=A0A6A2ZTA9_HIBSY|nr:hypothetical protein F3Y22_tig00110744pilonHSYRG00083 [Hibiscus syriacus]
MQHVDSDNNLSDYEAMFQDDFTDIDSSSDTEEILNSDSDEENKLLFLTKMGYSEVKASITMERYGLDSLIAELIDFICADQMAKATDALLMKQRKLEKKLLNEDDHVVHLSIPMIGSGVPTEPDQITQRTLPEYTIGSPYFYYEQIHLSNPMIGFGVHTKPDQITQRTLPEDAIGLLISTTRTWHLLHAKLTERICKALEAYDDEPPSSVQKYVLDECQKWNLVWVGRNKVTPLEPDEVEMLLEIVFYCLDISLKTDVQELNSDQLEQLMSRFGGFDLVVDGIQRNNLTGRNKHHQDEIEDFCCNLLKDMMDIILTKKMIGIEEVAMMYQDLSQHHGITRVQVDSGKVGSFKLVQYVASGFH